MSCRFPLVFLAITLLCAACAGRSLQADTPAAEPTLDMTARIDAAGRLEVDLALPVAWLGADVTSVDLAFPAERFASGQTGFGDFVRVVTPRGEQALAPLPVQGPILRARLHILLDHHRQGPIHGKDEVPHPVRGGWMLTGRALVPSLSILRRDGRRQKLELPGRLRWHLPAAWRLVASVDNAEGPARALESADLDGLREALYVVGSPSTRALRVHGVQLLLVTSDFSVAELDVLADLASRTLELGTRLLGRPTMAALTVVIDRDERRGGGLVGRGITLLQPELPTGSARAMPGRVLVHELVHVWNRADADWLSEGFARYLEVILTTRLDGAPAAQAAEDLAAALQPYFVAIGEGTIEATRGPPAYAAGATLAFCTDAALRARGRSFFELHQGVRGRADAQGWLRAADLHAWLEAGEPEVARAVRDWLQTRGPVDVAACARLVGGTAVVTRERGLVVRVKLGGFAL